MSRLGDVFLQHNGEPISEHDLPAIDAFEALLGPSAWTPEQPYWGSFLPMMELGALATVLTGVANSEGLLREAAKQVSQAEKRADPDLMAELHVGAMLVKTGHKVEFFPTQKGKKTPDLRVLDGPLPVDVEVRRGDRRHKHSEFQELLTKLTGRIARRDDCDLVVHLAEAPSAETEQQLIETCASIRPGYQTEDAGAWRVTAVPASTPSPDGFHDVAPPPIPTPDWWVGPSFGSTQGAFGGGKAAKVEVKALMPVASYFNPVRDKADRPQRSGDFPYVIALDTSSLASAEKHLLPDLQAAAPVWDHVSGVILTYPWFTFGAYEWRASLFRNPDARHPLPASFLGGNGGELAKLTL